MRGTTESVPLGPGVELRVLRFGKPGARPKAYIQAAIHADEIPPLLVADHLRRRLDALAAAGRIAGEIVLVPAANPVGLQQFVLGTHLGRFELGSGVNFNRQYPDLIASLKSALRDKLGSDAQANVRVVRAAALELLAQATPKSATQALKLELFRRSVDADIVLDLHCDYEAVLHVYLGASLWPSCADLSAELGAAVTLLSDDSGGSAFDEANSRIWWELARAFPKAAVPTACVAATIEYRGERDVDEARAAADAENLLRFLARRGVVAMEWTPAPAARAATPLEGVDYLEAAHDGVVIHRVVPGMQVRKGEVVAEVLDTTGGGRSVITARNDGIAFARRGHRYASRGQWIVKVAGAESLPWRQAGALLSD
jgi:predicted deacylase